MGLILIAILYAFISSISQINGYDPLDPNGNITIKWDILQVNDDSTQDVSVMILNYQLYRHIEHPGWKLSFMWRRKEVIWNMWGAETTEQGNCTAFRGKQKPHCCEQKPVIIDLLPGAPYTQQVANCCKGGVLSSIAQAPDKFGAGFQMTVGDSISDSQRFYVPRNFSIGVRGYTCGAPVNVPSTKFFGDHGRRRTQALATYNVTCTYSQFRARFAPTCCISLSSFYDTTIVPCPTCSCACQGQLGTQCARVGQLPPPLKLPNNEEPRPFVQCTKHMCPIRVHWHIKESYREYWRVKITITNFNFAKNYSEWNLVVLHPNLRNVTQVFSFNYKPLNPHGFVNDTGMFYGIKFYNDMLLQSGENGNVQSEIILHKDLDFFTFSNGWAFPRKISFNGEECVMPSPDNFPILPNIANLNKPVTIFILFPVFYFLHHFFGYNFSYCCL